ncbi:hypothetical protein PDQ04_13075 [Bacillus cereus]|uniref:hypothetical protein n=1 Tax=Bacillus TaxID=1386 RepID=UPI0008A3E31D|nr:MULTISPECIES: hypothetical protein [Bacillus]MDA2529365.1 hypothetical protein [Bacillus cereus]PGW74419.1 hypothetical protein COE11_18320 [Bacillus cereus]QIZ41291.1 hypothetical protein BHV55_06265 [Bacillus sp. RZ2MS9]
MNQWLSNNKRADHYFGGCILKFLLGMSLIFIFIIYPIYWIFFQEIERPLLKDTSPNQVNQIKITGIAYGHISDDKYIKIYFKEKEKLVEKTKVRVVNFNIANNPDLYKISWKDNTKASILMKFEYETKTLEYNFETGKISGYINSTNNNLL